jgi:chromosome segregation ATPase
MPFKLTKAEITSRNDLIDKLKEAAKEVEEAIDSFNSELEDNQTALQAKLDAYNELISEAQEFANEVAGRADEEISDKSETWQDGEKGQEATAWKDAWENLSFDEVEIDFPDTLDTPSFEAESTLDDAPTEASS